MANYAIPKSAIASKIARSEKKKFYLLKDKITSSGMADADN
jgi:hypothetical protein